MSDNVKRAREMLAAATPRPWRAEYASPAGHSAWAPCGPTGSMMVAACGHAGLDAANAALIAAAPALLAALCDEVDRLTRERDKAQALADETFARCDRALTSAAEAHDAMVRERDEAQGGAAAMREALHVECDARFCRENCDQHASLRILDKIGGCVANSCDRHASALMASEKGVRVVRSTDRTERALASDAGRALLNRLAAAESERAENARHTLAVNAINDVLANNGCDCDCGCDADGHSEDCDPCLACRVQDALRGET